MDQTKCARHTPIYAQKEWRESFSKHDKEIQIYVTLEKACAVRVPHQAHDWILNPITVSDICVRVPLPA